MKDIAAKRNSRDLICLSHLRWNFVFQRPQHLMTRFARTRRVFFFEEPIFDAAHAELRITRDHGVYVCVPHLPIGLNCSRGDCRTSTPSRRAPHDIPIERPVVWYYTPMALPFARHLSASAIVFDCMDELSAFHGAPPELLEARSRAAEPRRSGLHRRPEPVRSQTGASSPRLRVSEQRRRPAFRGRTIDESGPGRSGRHPSSATRLLRRGRRADGSASCSTRSPPPGPTGIWSSSGRA